MRWRFGLLILIGSLTLSGCSLPSLDKKPATTTPSTTTTTTPAPPPQPVVQTLLTASTTSFDQPVSQQVAAAQDKAKVWQADAVLHYVSVELPADLSLTAATDTYVFGSGKDADNWFTYSLNEATSKSIRAVIPKADYLGDSIVPINQSYWKMNYVEAFQLADANGGAVFRKAHTDARVTLYLSHRQPNQWLWWTVQYKASGSALLTLLVNPNQGEVIDSGGNQLVAPPAGSSAAGTSAGPSSAPASGSASSSASTVTP